MMRDPDIPLFAQLIEDWQTHHRELSRPGLQALAVYRYGRWANRIPSRLLRGPFSKSYELMHRLVRNLYGIELPYSADLGRRVTIEHQSGIVIHGDSKIGDDCFIRQGVTLGNRRLDEPNDAPKLGQRVNVGAGAKILGGVTIGDDAAVGANAVVTKDVPPGVTVVGIPARPVTQRKPPPDQD